MNKAQGKLVQRTRRHGRIRSRVVGSETRPRLAVYRSNRFIYAQLINDETSTTVAAADSRLSKGATPIERAKEVGQLIAEAAKKKGVESAVFDRGGFRYQGAIAALADGAREAGLSF